MLGKLIELKVAPPSTDLYAPKRPITYKFPWFSAIPLTSLEARIGSQAALFENVTPLSSDFTKPPP